MGNPVLSTPNAGRLDAALAGLDFMVSLDIYRNETTRHADFILPTTSVLERPMYDMAFLHNAVRNQVKWSPAVLPRPEGALHPWELLLELAARLNDTTREALEQVAFESLLGSTAPDRKDDVRALLERGPGGPARLLDARIRAGRYGDGYDDDGDGLSLEKLAASEHGIDLGPLEPRLPEMLATASGKVELAPELLIADVDRLHAALDRDCGLLLVGRRSVRDNNSWMHNVRALARGRARCTLQVHPDDAERLGLADGADARVASRAGEVVAPVEVSDALMPGVVSLPHGFGHGAPGTAQRVAAELQPGVNSNRLADEQLLDALSGNAVLNGIPVEIAPV
jgi:anaerobic selenocysteine-containing dehydrogenase